MKRFLPRVRLTGGALVLAWAAVMFVAAPPALASGFLHDVPGTPMGPSGVSGVVDSVTNPRDVFAVQLWAGQQVSFHVTPVGAASFPVESVWSCPSATLNAPRIGTIVDAEALANVDANDSQTELDLVYTPAVTGVYYLSIGSGDDTGVGYKVTVTGSESMPVGLGTYIYKTRDHDVPGALLGPSGADGVSDFTTNPTDLYAVQLFAGQPVQFTITSSNDTWTLNSLLFAPWIQYMSDAPGAQGDDPVGFDGVYGAVAGGQYGGAYVYSPSFSFTPSYTGVYYLAVSSEYSWNAWGYAHGVPYHIAISGSEGMPDSQTTWSVGMYPGYSARPIAGRTTYFRGVLSPSFASLALPSSTAQVQESTDTAHWFNDQTLSEDGVFIVGVAPTTERWYRLVFSGDEGYAGSTSDLIHIVPLEASSTMARSSVSSVKSRKAFMIYGHVTPAVVAGSCGLYAKRPGKGWSRVATMATNSGGLFSLRTSFKGKGTYSFYVEFYGSSQLATSASARFKVKVK